MRRLPHSASLRILLFIGVWLLLATGFVLLYNTVASP